MQVIETKYGKIEIISEFRRRMPVSGLQKALFCKCFCGNKFIVDRWDLFNRTQSCGCCKGKYKENIVFNIRSRTHGDTYTVECKTWAAMRRRGNNPKDPPYKDYGARGITICKRWDKYTNFLEDIGRKSTPKHSLDRIDNNGNYEPSNCRWATMKEQANNTRVTRKIDFGDGLILNMLDASKAWEISRSTLYRILDDKINW